MHSDLLDQAKILASYDAKRPRQANLRRAISAAYYALYHLLVREGADRLAPGQPARLRHQVRRAFNHANMKKVCEQFSYVDISKLAPSTRVLITAPIEPNLALIADSFVVLQEERHRADYDTWESFSRVDALHKIYLAERAITAWDAVKNSQNASVFLAALLLHGIWKQ